METMCYNSFIPDSSWMMINQRHITTPWTKEENKRFESALAIFDEKTPNRWRRVAEQIPGKSVYDVINQYRELVADVSDIEQGRGVGVVIKIERKVYLGPKTNIGLQKHGKGDWRSISRNFVITKTPTQVASHAQKYYLRQQISGGKDKRRPSIHDITTDNIITTDANKAAAPSEAKKAAPLSEKSNELITSVLDWNNNHSINDGPLMAFGSTCGDSSFVSYPHELGPHSRYIIQSPKFHG